MKRLTAAGIFLLFSLILVLLVILVFTLFKENQNHYLAVTFLDVGQGDAIFIESPTGTQTLIDGGPHAEVLKALGKEMGFFDRSIDLVIATHPDADHIGGLVDVLKRYDVAAILITENRSDTPVSGAFFDAVTEEGANIYYARGGQTYDLGRGPVGTITLRVLFPDRNVSGLESNTSSIVTQLDYGETQFMFTGDSPTAIESYLVSLYGTSLQSEVLKAGHHGSRTSSSMAFVEQVAPTYAIISAGKDNRYGHPHKEVLEIFETLGITTKNTADVGSISFVSNGRTVKVR